MDAPTLLCLLAPRLFEPVCLAATHAVGRVVGALASHPWTAALWRAQMQHVDLDALAPGVVGLVGTHAFDRAWQFALVLTLTSGVLRRSSSTLLAMAVYCACVSSIDQYDWLTRPRRAKGALVLVLVLKALYTARVAYATVALVTRVSRLVRRVCIRLSRR
jgi:hypothetical protein